MEKRMDYGYPPSALRQEDSGIWRLAADFAAEEAWYIETAEDARDLAEESWALIAARDATAWQARDPLPLARLCDAEGRVRAEGVLSGDVPLVLARAGARPVRLDRMEIDGVLALYVPSEWLEAGQTYVEEHAEIVPRAQAQAAQLAAHGLIGTGAMVATNEGPQPVDWLRAGDLLLTRDNGYQPLLHIEQLSLAPNTEPAAMPRLIAGGVFGAGLPERGLVASAGTELLLGAPQLELWFGEAEMFATLAQLAPDLPPAPKTSVVQALWAVILPEPEVILAEGLWVGSTLATPELLALLPERARARLAGLAAARHRQSARACLADWEAAMFVRKVALQARVAA